MKLAVRLQLINLARKTLAFFKSPAHQAIRPIGNIDKLTGARITGWAAGPGKLTVEAWIDDRRVSQVQPNIERKDVAAAYPRLRSATLSGFSLTLPNGLVEDNSIARVKVVARSSIPVLRPTTLGIFQIAGADLGKNLSSAIQSDLLSPFPRRVTDAIRSRWPDDCVALDTVAGQRRFARRLGDLLSTPAINSLPFIAEYARYLGSTYAHCRFVEKHFPTTNALADSTAADFHSKPNSIHELFPIIHQLYVLRSHGLEGDFVEAGCFKGYSSSMLSYACGQLELKMHIFDSFEGLPPCEGSGYEAGQYAGHIDEVRNNIAHFGDIRWVDFHKGFFADSLRKWQPSEVICLWMDVDLESSAKDLMQLADRLHERATIFSHECVAQTFKGGKIESPPSPDNPIAPVLSRFEQLGRPLTGHHVSGFTGAFWAKDGGIPVVDTEVLFDLVRKL